MPVASSPAKVTVYVLAENVIAYVSPAVAAVLQVPARIARRYR